MPRLPHRRAARSIALSLLTLTAGSAAGRPSVDGTVVLIAPVAVTSVAQLPGMLANKVEHLAQIDPDHPVGPDSDLQTLSLFGREDLIAPSSPSYTPTHCAPLASATPVLAEIARRARETRIVIINESHERSEHRGFSARVARALRPLGYDVLALETLSNPPADVPARYLPSFRLHPERNYFADDDGHYLSEAGYGRFGRTAKTLGYTLLAYEDVREPSPSATPAEQIATREELQATLLAAFVASHPRAHLLVHVGYSHAAEVPQAGGARWMAARLKQKTGIDPLTISQTTCRGGGATTRLAVLPAGQPAGSFDLVVDHPGARFVQCRPEWRRAASDQLVAIPRALYPLHGWRVIEARPLGEPDLSVPMDRVAIRPGEDVALLLPPGRYALRAIDVGAKTPAR
ncbi:hypothetical protein [Sphingomonas sp. CARO-RG-8B-R24-01]|uniref:hypothetical protein n=1 Tax=Sphingomonas sp. CARO-RG-8B-R24-01 TaxID=2914831 RepID=UPI001F5911BE|nr:hypothetical protein [Sphingomonas sp. CARO-RG-8B-R24-01]